MAEDIPSNMTVKELQDSGAPGVSAIRRWYESARGGSSAMARAKLHAAAAGQGMRQGGESLLVGGLLGALHAKKGLDFKKVPLDAAAGVVGLIGGAALAHEEFGVDLRNSGAAALSIFGFRKTYDFLVAKMRAKGQEPGGKFAGDDEGFVPHGDFGAEDPIIAAARFL